MAAPKGRSPTDEPAGYFVVVPPESNGAQIDIRQVVSKLWAGRIEILSCSVLFALLAAFHAFFLATPTYRSQAVIAVRTTEPGGSAPLGGQLSGLASLAGINLHGSGPSRIEYVGRLRSRQIVEDLIQKQNLLPLLFNDKYDFNAKQWREPDRAPSLEDGVQHFLKICQISEDPDTGLLTVQITWRDRFQASEWVNDLVNLANSELRAAASREAQGNIEYLKKQSTSVQVESLRESIVHLMETNLNQAMLADAQRDFAFKVIDPPSVSDVDKFVLPLRLVEVAGGFVAGALLAVVVVLWQRRSFWQLLRRSRKDQANTEVDATTS